MTAPRVCRACGADLPGGVRWCLRCYEPARELTPRAPIWAPGEFVDAPIHTGGAVPHWSRWEKSATTFGPTGRVVATTLMVLWVIGSVMGSLLTLIFVVPVVILILRAVWQPGWVIPEGTDAVTPPREPIATWLWDRSEVVRTIGLAVLAFVGVGLLLYEESPVVRFVVIVSGVVLAGAWLFRKIGGSR